MDDLKRSWMFVPGNRQKMIDKAMALKLDAIMLDIEDGVAPADKAEARRLIGQALLAVASAAAPAAGPDRYVRVNAIGHREHEADLEAVVVPGLQGLVLPKVDDVEKLRWVDEKVGRLERERGIASGGIKFLVAIESPRGLFAAAAIGAASRRVTGMIFGAEDFARELGLPIIREGEASELLYARSQFVLAAAVAGVQSVDGVWPNIQDPEGLLKDSVQARRLGFTGKSLIHPGQAETINRVFSPAPPDVEFATEVIQSFEAAQARGEGSIAFRGQLIDLPIVERARQTVRLATLLGGR